MRIRIFSIAFIGMIMFSVTNAIQGYSWPTNGANEVCGSFGTYEDTPLAKFHNGIDIAGTGGVTKVITIAKMKVLRIQEDQPNQAVVIFEILTSGGIPTGKYAAYGHLKRPPANDPLRTPGTIIDAGTGFATIATTSEAGTTFAHTHFTIFSNFFDPNLSNSNPLLEPAVGNKDPGGNTPIVGPFFIKRSGGKYLIHATDPNLYGKVELIAQITDNMGHKEPNPGNQIDNDAWPNPANLYHGITSTPYKVEYWISDSNYTAVKSTETYTFSDNPDDSKMATLYEHDKDVDGNPGADYLAYNYCFNLTNLIGDRYWNTKLKEGEAWNGADAWINAQALFTDSEEHKIEIRAYDLTPSTATKTYKIKLDNFIPYVEKVVIIQNSNDYIGAWPNNPGTSDLGNLVNNNNDTFSSGGIGIRLFFSEDMDTSINPALSIKFPSGLDKSISGGSWINTKYYSVSTASDFIPPNENGSATLKISNAKDLAGNLLDGNPKTIAFRDASGSWSGKDSPPDTLHHKIVNQISFPTMLIS